MQSIQSYGVTQTTERAGALERLVEEVRLRGYAVVTDVITAGEAAELSARLKRVYMTQCDEAGGESALNSINDTDIVRCPLAYDDLFMDLAMRAPMIDVVKRLLGQNIVLLMQNGVINRPRRVQAQTRWHRDLNYQHWVCSEPLAISALVCLCDFDQSTGGTVLLPYSHEHPQFPSGEFIAQHEVTIDAPRGSAIIFDSMLFHRAGVNRSEHERIGINHVIGRPILAQQIDIPQMLARPEPNDPWLAGFLGYRWNPVHDVRSWRLRKIAQHESSRSNLRSSGEK